MRRISPPLLWAIITCFLCFPCTLSARLRSPEGTEDIGRLADHASFIFHAQVLSIESVLEKEPVSGEIVQEVNIANLAVRRWYKGEPGSETIRLKYIYPGFGSGDDCIDLNRSSSWLIFAKLTNDGAYEFSDVCEGGLPVSAILAPATKGNWLHQLQRDLIAGFQDADPDLRLANIARLGALKLRSSGRALHELIENGNEIEARWAIYAALRSGDPSVFPKVESILIERDSLSIRPQTERPDESLVLTDSTALLPDSAAPQCSMEGLNIHIQYEIGNLWNPEAVPMLARIAASAQEENVRSLAFSAIRSINDPRALAALVDLLNGPDPKLRTEALDAIAHITTAPECQHGEAEEESIEPCKMWWEHEGRFIEWPTAIESASR
jgi:HEAT repeat protein